MKRKAKIVVPAFVPLSCQCGRLQVTGTTALEITRDWVALDSKDHHLGRPCLSGLKTL